LLYRDQGFVSFESLLI